jgi:hypothetical protein
MKNIWIFLLGIILGFRGIINSNDTDPANMVLEKIESGFSNNTSTYASAISFTDVTKKVNHLFEGSVGNSIAVLNNQIDLQTHNAMFLLNKPDVALQFSIASNSYNIHAISNFTSQSQQISAVQLIPIPDTFNISLRHLSSQEIAHNKSWHAYQQAILREPQKQLLIQDELQKLESFIGLFGVNPTALKVEDQLRFRDLPQLFCDYFPNLNNYTVLYENKIWVLNKFQEILFPKGEFAYISQPLQIQQIARAYCRYLKSINSSSYLEQIQTIAQNNEYFKQIYIAETQSKNLLGYIAIPFNLFYEDFKEIWHENYNYLKVLPQTSYNVDVQKCVAALEAQDFDAARKIFNTYKQLAISYQHLKKHAEYLNRFNQLKNLYEQAYFREYNKYGIKRSYAIIDPYFQHIETLIQNKQLLCTPDSLTARRINTQLQTRHAEIMNIIGSQNPSPKEVQIAYAIIDNKTNPELIIEYLAQFSKNSSSDEDRKIFQTFCNDSGIPKHLIKENGELVDGMRLPAELGLEKYADLRVIASKILIADISIPEIKVVIEKTIQYVREACLDTPLADDYAVLARTLFNEFKQPDVAQLVSECTNLASPTPITEQQQLKEALIPRIAERAQQFVQAISGDEQRTILNDISKLNQAYVLMTEHKYIDAHKLMEEVDHPEILIERLKEAEISTQQYKILPQTAYLLEQYKADPKSLVVCEGNIVQQHIHSKVINTLNHAARLYWHEKSIPQLKPITSTTTRLSLLAHDLNRKNDVYRSTHILNLCDQILKIGDIVCEGLKGASLGIMDAAIATALLPYNLGHAAIHPIQTGINIASGIHGLTSILSHYAPPDYSIFESDPQYIDMYHRIMQTKSDNLEMTLQLVFETIKQQTVQDITRAVTSNITQGIFAGQVFKGVGVACQYTKNTAYFTDLVNNVHRAKERISPHVRSVIDKIKAIELKKPGFIEYPKNKIKNEINNLSKVPDYISGNRIPLDRDTILVSKEFTKTKIPRVNGAAVYKHRNRYYHRDTFHEGKGAHLEVYDSRGRHLGEAHPQTGELLPNTLDKTKTLEF